MLSDRYQPKDVEAKNYAWWESKGYFKAQDLSTKPPYCVIMPPPNVTGFLHLGHALDASIQDCLIRWKRMSGFNALWLPGIDHAGIATQAVMEKELKKEKLTRQELGREKFLERVWQWKEQYGSRISNQQKRLGASCDWDRSTFTLDPGVSKAVRSVFVQLHKKGLIYRGQKLINWSTPLETAISDLEVEYKEIKGSMYHISYPIVGTSDFLVVATTRPETLLGDVAVAVHPDDERYKKYTGMKVQLPLTGRQIPIVQDSFVDLKFGSGVVKITPAHDFTDYQVGRKHDLPLLNILNKDGTLNENAGSYQGLNVQFARKKVLEDLTSQNLLLKEEPHLHSVGHCSRTGAVVEPFLSDQWFVRMESLAVPARRAVENGSISIEPESWTKTYLHWLNNIDDWCISRQLWWGHRIPAWHCGDCQKVTIADTDPSECSHCHSKNIVQDEDVLDTWFSSALWPFSTLGWPDQKEALKTFYPTSVMVTGHDILFFWVARMVMMGLEFVKDVPFRKVFLHGLIRDSQGRKMSKSLGNSIDPVDMIEKYGTDALRFSMLAHLYSGKDLKMSEQRIEGYRNFMNKLWNAARFGLGKLEDFDATMKTPAKSALTDFDQWIIFQLGKTIATTEKALNEHRLSDAASALYHFLWYELCDWYLEFSKPLLASPTTAEEKTNTQYVLAHVFSRVLKLLHPFAPFITEEIYQKWPIRGEACIVDTFPTVRNQADFLSLGGAQAAADVQLIIETITAIRNIRGENRISPATQMPVKILLKESQTQKLVSQYRHVIETIGRTTNLEVLESMELKACAVSRVSHGNYELQVVVPLDGLVDLQEEVKRLQKVLEKLEKDQQVLQSKLSNPKFRENADPEVIAADDALLLKIQRDLVLTKEAIARF